MLDKAMQHIEDHLRRANNCKCSSRLLLAEYEAHKARQCDAVPEVIAYQVRCKKDFEWVDVRKWEYEMRRNEVFSEFETRALGVIDPIQPGSTTS